MTPSCILSNIPKKRVIIQTTRYLNNIAESLSNVLQTLGCLTAIRDAAQIDVIIRNQTTPTDIYFIFLFVWHIQTLPINNQFII